MILMGHFQLEILCYEVIRKKRLSSLGVLQLFLLPINIFGIYMLRFSVPSYPQFSDSAFPCHALKERGAKSQQRKACKCLNKNTKRMRKLYWINFSLICYVERCKEERETALSEILI